MTAELVNLRRARKAKARVDAAGCAARNRAAFGRSGAERALQAKSVVLDARRLDGHRLIDPRNAEGAGDDGG